MIFFMSKIYNLELIKVVRTDTNNFIITVVTYIIQDIIYESD